jgi:hypothetical protein
MDPILEERYRLLFRFYDIDGTGRLSMDSCFRPVAETLAARWYGRKTPFPDIRKLLIDTYQRELERRDLDQNGVIHEQEFLDSHAPIIFAFLKNRRLAEIFIERAAGGFFDCLDLDGDGILQLADIEAYASAYGKPTGGIRKNLARMLEDFNLPPDRLPRDVFLILVQQYWFDASPNVPGRRLFHLNCIEDTSACNDDQAALPP